MVSVDIQNVRKRFSRAIETYDNAAVAQRAICKHLIRLVPTNKSYINALEVGCGTGILTNLLLQQHISQHWTINDLCPEVKEKVKALFEKEKKKSPPRFHIGDIEKLTFEDQTYDLIISASMLQWLRNPKLFYERVSNWLQPEGFFVFNTFSSQNFHEIRSITGTGLLYPSTNELTAWMNKGLKILQIHKEQISLQFDSPIAMLRHLKETGVTAIGNTKWTKHSLNTFSSRYQKEYGTKDGKVKLTYCPIYFVTQKK